VLFAFPTEPERAAETDPQVLEMTCTPRKKRVLVTDGTSELGLSLIEGLLAAGAQTVWSGTPGSARAQAMPAANVLPLPLDVTAAASVAAAAQELGSKVDIVINNTEVHGASGAVADNLELAQAEINTNYIGLLRLASAFTPHLLSRTQGEDSRPTAWVNVLSIYALSTLPSHGTYCASKAAALSLAYNLRAQLRPSGIRVLNVFPGPIDDGAYRDLSQPKLAPRTLARAIVQALESGQEDCYPDDVAQERLQRWRQDPKLLELEPQP
jgi:NAD(P)-dependent dehydrogenase (short-subunit alcohol dehydrogenase family)